MEYFAGLDVSVNETSVCIVDDAGRIVREVKVASEAGALLAALKNGGYHFKRIGLEAGPLSQWLYSALGEAASEGEAPCKRTSFHHQPEAQHPKSSAAIHKINRPITPSMGQ